MEGLILSEGVRGIESTISGFGDDDEGKKESQVTSLDMFLSPLFVKILLDVLWSKWLCT